jgi:hypothetical protein
MSAPPPAFVTGAPPLARALETAADASISPELALSHAPPKPGTVLGWVAYTAPLLLATAAVAVLALK